MPGKYCLCLFVVKKERALLIRTHTDQTVGNELFLIYYATHLKKKKYTHAVVVLYIMERINTISFN